MPRAIKRTPNRRACESRKLTLCLWSAGGELVRRVDAFGHVSKAPSFSMWGGQRYDRMMQQPSTHGIVHYRAAVIERKASA
jgi:hypothetical protein